MAPDPRTCRPGLSRRTFLRYSAAAGMLLGAGPLLREPGAAWAARRQKALTERRTYLFNLSHVDSSAHAFILVAGKQRVRLNRVNPGVLALTRKAHPILTHVPTEDLTHYVDLRMPADTVQLCYVQRVPRKAKDRSWEMGPVFYHHPSEALHDAWQRRHLRAEAGLPTGPVKWERYGLTSEVLSRLNDPVGEEMFHDATSHAVALVAGHPELASVEPKSAAHIQGNIIGTQRSTEALAIALMSQGTNWATQTPLIDPDTGQPYRNSQGQNQYVPVWSERTNQAAGDAIHSALETVKDDTSLGVNITDIDPTAVITNDPGAAPLGKIWTVHDGRPAVDQSLASSLGAGGLSYTFTDQSPGYGYAVEVKEVSPASGVDPIVVTFTVKNWYVRHLGLWVRYLDAAGQPIPTSQIAVAHDPRFFPFGAVVKSGQYDVFLAPMSPEFVVMGIPVTSTTVEQKVPLPPNAASALVLAGGLGVGDNAYPDTLVPGVFMTIVLELAVPTIFLALAATAALGMFLTALADAKLITSLIQLIILLAADITQTVSFNNPAVFKNLAPFVATKLLGKAAGWFDALLAESIAEGEAETAVTDAFPVLGLMMSAVGAIGTVAQLVETAAEVCQSPMTYVGKITFTHDVAVTILHDPNDPAFPATAASYTVTAVFDGGTPHTITQAMPSGPVTDPILVTFRGVPAGGQVSVTVEFHSSNTFLVGKGSVGPDDNTPTAETLHLTLTITEAQVPLTSQTVYSHRAIIALDAEGHHQWHETTSPPSVVTPEGLCEQVPGQLCALTGITVSTTGGAVGYSWQAYSPAVTACGSGTAGQLHQFAGLSTPAPESGRLFSGCGFSGRVRLVYDLLGRSARNFYLDPTINPALNRGNFIRQLGLDPPSFDGPGSNRAWGALRFPSDALLLHPLGKIISVNTQRHKLEVLDLPATAVPDADAPQSQVYSGFGTREGRMKGPLYAALSPQGTILVLESENNRIQAFDLHGNPVPHFAGGHYFVPLHDTGATYLDLAVEYSGFMYVLSYVRTPSYVYRLDIYNPDGSWLARTTGVNADKLAVNYWREVFTLNYQVLTVPNGSPQITEPSVSHWIPSLGGASAAAMSTRPA